MSLVFHNNSGRKIWTAWGMWYPTTCPGERGNYVVKGWFEFAIGERATVSTDDMRGPAFYVFANDANNNKWSGSRAVGVSQQAFERCINDFISLNPAYFKEFPRTSSNHIVTFNP